MYHMVKPTAHQEETLAAKAEVMSSIPRNLQEGDRDLTTTNYLPIVSYIPQ